MAFEQNSSMRDAALADNDPGAETRKGDHIKLAFDSQVKREALDKRFYYEPLFAAHPKGDNIPETTIAGKRLRLPVWVSSMTGGAERAGTINRNLARACREFGMGMGLGSCRQLLYSDEHLSDFDMRDLIGEEQPLFANLGIAQIEQLFAHGQAARMNDLVQKLRADGLIIHVNPLQEAMQPGGDQFKHPPLDTIQRTLDVCSFPIIVKEVGQGMGPASLEALLKTPLAAIELAAAGGTNFAKLELLRSEAARQDVFAGIATLGHDAGEMLEWLNAALARLGAGVRTQRVIVSGGVKDFLDGYYYIKSAALPAVYGQASGFLKYAQGDYAVLQAYIESQMQGLALAYAYLKVR